MLLIEFAAQGVRGVAPPGGRAALRAGYNVVAAEGPALRRLLEALLRPDPRDGEALLRAAGPGAGIVRAGLTLVGDDRITYRLVRDFGAGCQLQRFDPERRAFAPVSQDLAEIAAFLRQPVGVPGAGRQAALLSLGAAELPSRTGSAGLAGGGASLAQARPQPLTPEQARRRRAELEAELGKARAAEALQERLDGLQQRLFKLEEALKSGQRVNEGLAAAEAERAALEPLAQAVAGLGDAQAALAAHDKATARRDEALARVAAEREARASAEEQGAPAPFWLDPRFWAGAGAGVLALAAGAAGASQGSELRALALLGIPAFGWSAWVADRWIGAREAWERRGRRAKVVDDWERKVLEQHERDAAAVSGVVRALGLAKPAELREQLERLGEADRAVAEWRERRAAWQADAATGDALAEKAQVEEELREVETRLASEAGGFVRDVRTVEAELDRLEAGAGAPEPAAEAAAPVPPPEPAPAPVTGEPLRGLLERAAAELGGSPAAVGRSIAPKASQALSGLTAGRLAGVAADDRGNVQVVVSGRPVPALTLPPADRDLVYVALKLALLEQALAGGRAVAILDDPFGGLPDGARRTIGRLLKQLARGGQVVHATTDPAFREAADHQA